MAQKRTTKKTSTGTDRRKSGRRTAKKPKVYITSYDELERPITKTIETKSIKYNHQYEQLP